MGYYDNDGNYIPTDDEEFLNGDVPIRSEEEEQYILEHELEEDAAEADSLSRENEDDDQDSDDQEDEDIIDDLLILSMLDSKK